MKLIDVLQKMKVGDLKKEISKQNIKGYSKMKKEEIINLMLDNKKRFKYLLLQNLEQKKEILQDKVKLKEAKDKLKKLTAKKEPKKKKQSQFLQKQVAQEQSEMEIDTPQFEKYKKDVENFVKNPTASNYNLIDIDLAGEKTKSGRSWFTLYDRLPEKLQEKFEKVEDKYQTELKKKEVNKKTEEPKKSEYMKKYEKALEIKAEPKKQLIKTKTGVVTVKPKKELTKDELKLVNLEKEQKKLENKRDSLGRSQKDIDEKLNLKNQIMEIKLSIFQLKDKLKEIAEKKAIEDEKKALKQFKKDVQDFIKNPNDDLLEKIENNFEYIDDLPENLQDKFEKVLEKFENKDKQVNKKTEPEEQDINKLIKLANKEGKNIEEQKEGNDISIFYNGKLDIIISLLLDLYDKPQLTLEIFKANFSKNKNQVKKGFSRLLLCEILKNIQKKYKLKDDTLVMVDAADLRTEKGNTQALFKKVYQPLGFIRQDKMGDVIEGETKLEIIINKCKDYKEDFEKK